MHKYIRDRQFCAHMCICIISYEDVMISTSIYTQMMHICAGHIYTYIYIVHSCMCALHHNQNVVLLDIVQINENNTHILRDKGIHAYACYM